MSNRGFKVDKHLTLRPQASEPVDTEAGDLYFDGSDLKFNDGSSTKSIVKGSRSVTLTNNQATPADIDGFSVDGSTETGFHAEYTVTRARMSSLSLDTTFNPSAAGRNYRVVGQPDGKVLLCGDFGSYGGDSTRKFFIRINADGTEDASFNNNLASNSGGGGFQFLVTDAIVQSDNKIIVCGQFTQYGTDGAKDWILRFNSDGTEDTAFSTIVGAGGGVGGRVYSVAFGANNTILVGGQFSSYAGDFNRDFVIRFNNDILIELVKQGSIRGRYLPLSETWSTGGGSYIGDDVGVTLSMTDSGQMQYTSTDISAATTNVDKIDFTLIKT